MSHSGGEVIIGDQIVGYFEYNGTSNVATNRIQPDRDAVSKHWRTPHNNDATCVCGRVAF